MDQLIKYLLENVHTGKLQAEKAADLIMEYEEKKNWKPKDIVIIGFSQLQYGLDVTEFSNEVFMEQIDKVFRMMSSRINILKKDACGVIIGKIQKTNTNQKEENLAYQVVDTYQLNAAWKEVNLSSSSAVIMLDEACRGLQDGTYKWAIVATMLDEVEISVLMLTTKEYSLQQQSTIFATIKGLQVAEDTKRNRIYLPNPKQQSDLIFNTWEKSGVDPAEISYIEMSNHNDRLFRLAELEAITMTDKKRQGEKAELVISSITECSQNEYSATGLLSVIRAIKVLANEVYPSGEYTSLETSKTMENQNEKPWKVKGTLRYCGVDILTKYGVAGHLLLEEGDKLRIEGVMENILEDGQESGNVSMNDPDHRPNEYTESVLRILKSELGKQDLEASDCFKDYIDDTELCFTIFLKLKEQFSLEWKLSDYLECDTANQIGQAIKECLKENVQSKKWESAPKQEYYPLLPGQKMILLHQFMHHDAAYNIPRVLYLEGKVDVDRMEQIFATLVQRHHALRTSFVLHHGGYMQKVNEEVPFKMEYEEIEYETTENIIRDFIRVFQLDKPPLFRAKLVKLSEGKYLLMLDMHHIISDRSSIVILMNEFQQLYQGKTLPDRKYHYEDYVYRFQEYEKSEIGKLQEEYWLSQFSDGMPDVELKTDFVKGKFIKKSEKSVDHEFDDAYRDVFSSFCSAHGVTINMLMLSVFHILLWKWLGKEDVVTGLSSQGRTQREMYDMFGMFVNTLPIRNHVISNETFLEFLNQTKERLLGAYSNQEYPFDLLTAKVREKHKQMDKSLINTLFIMQNTDYSDLDLGDIKAVPYQSYIETDGRFDLQINIFNSDKKHLNICFIYSQELFKEDSIKKLLRGYLDILDQAVKDSGKLLKDFSVNV